MARKHARGYAAAQSEEQLLLELVVGSVVVLVVAVGVDVAVKVVVGVGSRLRCRCGIGVGVGVGVCAAYGSAMPALSGSGSSAPGCRTQHAERGQRRRRRGTRQWEAKTKAMQITCKLWQNFVFT